MQPILHLSIPVRDMDEARDFYVRTLGCQSARTRVDFTDVWFYRHADRGLSTAGREHPPRPRADRAISA